MSFDPNRDEEISEDYEEMEQKQDTDYGGDDDQGYYEGGVGSDPSFTFGLNREPEPRDFKSYEARPWGHRQPRPPQQSQPKPPQPSLWESVTGRKRGKGSSWTDYGSF